MSSREVAREYPLDPMKEMGGWGWGCGVGDEQSQSGSGRMVP